LSGSELDAAVRQIEPLSVDEKKRLLPLVIERFKKGDDWRILVAFEYLGPTAKDAAPLLLPLLRSYNVNDNVYGGRAIGAIGYTNEGDLDSLIENMASDLPFVRSNTAEVLGQWGRPADKAIPALVKGLRDPEWQVRRSATQALGKMTPTPQSVSGLIAVLQAPDAGVEMQAAQSLGVMGNTAKDAAPILRKLIADRGGVEGVEPEFVEALKNVTR